MSGVSGSREEAVQSEAQPCPWPSPALGPAENSLADCAPSTPEPSAPADVFKCRLQAQQGRCWYQRFWGD